MQNRSLRLGPTTLAASAANIFNAPTITGGSGVPADVVSTYVLLKHIRIVNRTTGVVNVSLYIGATGASAAGTEFSWNAYPVPANGYVEWYGPGIRLTSSDFLTGFASAANALTFEAEGEIGIAG